MRGAERRRSWVWAAAVLALGCGGSPARPEVAVVNLTAAPAPRAEPTSEPTAEPEAPRTKLHIPVKDPKVPEPSTEGEAEKTERARQIFKEGAEAYSNGDYTLALSRFRDAYALVPLNALLFNIATCELKLGHQAQSCDLFRKYVANGDPTDPRIQQVSQQVAQRCP